MVQLLVCTLEKRDYRMAETLQLSREKSHIEVLLGWRDELFPVVDKHREVVNIERAGSALFVIMVYGVHMTGYVKTSDGDSDSDGDGSLKDGFRIWVAQRPLAKSVCPSMLENTVGGGIASGEEVFGTLVREAEEKLRSPWHMCPSMQSRAPWSRILIGEI